MNRDEFTDECRQAQLTPGEIEVILASGRPADQLALAVRLAVKKLHDRVAPLLSADDGKPEIYAERDVARGKWMRQVFLSKEEYAAFAVASDHNLANYQLAGLYLKPPRIRQK